ncbi:organic hydroperoxide resistance protein [Erythrobacter sp. NFXS35]|uniref:organic hydroperoxide resistance protein n=1 Tax=Erythrobacter sp. NFXS35 TaxID=2818436 RepID=UPI0032DF5CE5
MKPLYTATATASGGRNGHVESDDGLISLDLAIPAPMGGPGGGSNPEQLFAAGYAACFHSALQFIAGQSKTDVSGSTVTGRVTIGARDDGPGFGLAVHHEVMLPTLSQSDSEKLVAQAHEVCPYSNATRGNVTVDFTVTGGQA